jgi:transposase
MPGGSRRPPRSERKTADQQAAVLLHRGRERLVRQRTGLVNALRGHLAEFGVIAPQGLRNVGKLIAIVRDEGDARLPELARQVLQVLAAQIEQLEAAVAAIRKQLMAWHKSNPVSQRLASVPGIGPIIATAIAATVVEPSGFRSGREFAAWLGLVRSKLALALEGDQCRSVGDRTAPAAAELVVAATAEFHRRQTSPGRDIQARQTAAAAPPSSVMN